MKRLKLYIIFVLVILVLSGCSRGNPPVMLESASSATELEAKDIEPVYKAKEPSWKQADDSEEDSEDVSVEDKEDIASVPAPEPVAEPVEEQTTQPEEPELLVSVERDGNIDDDVIYDAEEQLKLIPRRLQELFVADDWHFYITDCNISLTFYQGRYGHVLGTTNYDEERILVENRPRSVKESAIHEFGHWLDHHCGTITDSRAFSRIYLEESQVFIKAYGATCVRDKKELFAEGFWKYIIDPERLEDETPDLYEFIDTVVNEQ